MFEISWGEMLVVGAVGVAMTGKKDLPAVCRFVGTQIGRFVGLLQGARVRADQFAQQNELRQLQNELRAGLRELDHVKMELAVAASSQGVIGRKLGPTTASANNIGRRLHPQVQHSQNQSPTTSTPITNTGATARWQQPTLATVAPQISSSSTSLDSIGTPSHSSHGSFPQHQHQQLPMMDFDVQIVDDDNNDTGRDGSTPSSSSPLYNLPPVIQTERAVMEEEWEKQGIGFRAIGEQHNRGQEYDHHSGSSYTVFGGQDQYPTSTSVSGRGGLDNSAERGTAALTGSELLERLERQNLIFDQYDRVVAEKEHAMDERIRERIHKQQHRQQDPESSTSKR